MMDLKYKGIEMKTTYGDDKKSSCLICKTTYQTGKARWVKGCSCGNIVFFDITNDFVRICIQFPIVYVSSIDNWELEIINQINEFGRPLKYKNIDSKVDWFDYESKYNI